MHPAACHSWLSLWSSEEGTNCSPHFTVQSNTGTEDVGGFPEGDENESLHPQPSHPGICRQWGSVCEQEFVPEPWQGSPMQ